MTPETLTVTQMLAAIDDKDRQIAFLARHAVQSILDLIEGVSPIEGLCRAINAREVKEQSK